MPRHDRPADQAADHSDHEATDHGRSDQPPTDRLTTPEPVPIEEAAAALGISVNAVLQRLKRGTLTGIKTDAGWSMSCRPHVDRPETSDRPTNHRDRPRPTNRPQWIWHRSLS